MPEISDDFVLPAYLDAAPGDPGGAEGSLADTTLRVGEVVQALAPDDPANRGAFHNRQWVYVVNVTYRDGAGMRSVVPYRCTVADLFGGLADHLRYTVRPAPSQQKSVFGSGARVLVLCPNGDKSEALIVGGIRHPQDASPDPSDSFLNFLFNGVHLSVDRDGALTLTVPGATTASGEPDPGRDPSNHGSSVSMAKDGTVTVTDQVGESVVVSPRDRTISVRAGEHSTDVERRWVLRAPTVEVEAEEVTVKADKVNLGAARGDISILDEAVVGSGIDTFTGLPYKILGNTSGVVRVKK